MTDSFIAFRTRPYLGTVTTNMVPQAGPASPIVTTYLGGAEITTDLTTYTFAASALGTATADRRIVVGIGGRLNGSGPHTDREIVSVTVNGVSATQVVTIGTDDGVNNPNRAALWIADVPSDTSGDIVVVWEGAMTRCGIQWWGMTGAASGTASDTGTDSATSPLNDTITIPANGNCIGYALWIGSAAPPATVSTGCEDDDAVIEVNTTHSGAHLDSVAGGATAVDASTATALTSACGVFAAWGP